MGADPAPGDAAPRAAVVDAAVVDAVIVDAVIVSYDSASTITRCLSALLRQPALASVQVVDNGSRDGTVERVRAIAATATAVPVRLIEQPGNPGFAAGCNAGARAGQAPWLLFVNPDVELPDGALARLLAHANAGTRSAGFEGALRGLGALGADLRGADGARDPAARRRDLSLSRMLRAAGSRGALDVAVEASMPLQPVQACSGALLLVPRTAFDAVGGWDAGYRLHVEDLDFCRRLRAAGFGVAVANDVAVLHHRGVSSRARPFFVEWHKHRGLWRYWWRFEAGGAAALLAPLVLAALAARLLAIAWPRAALRILGPA